MFKDHFIAVLCGTDVSFPAKLWYYVLVQAEHQLNMLRKSRVDKSKSSYEVMYGQHDYNATPWAPLGSIIEVHVMPQNRKKWSEHTLTGWCLGNAKNHYRCHEVWVKDTKRTRISQTVFLKTNFITKPEFTTTDALLRSTEDLVQLIRGNAPVKGDARKAVDLLLDIFKRKIRNSDTEIDVQRQQILKAATNLANAETVEMDAVTNSDFDGKKTLSQPSPVTESNQSM